MTYARARLLLGMFGVGSMVVLSTFLLLSKLPLTMLPDSRSWSVDDLAALLLLVAGLIAVLFPLDLLGGFLLPNRWRPNTITLRNFVASWLRGALAQGAIFLVSGLLILGIGRWLGLTGVLLAVVGIAMLLVAFQLQIAKLIGGLSTRGADSSSFDPDQDVNPAAGNLPHDEKISQVLSLISKWGWEPRPIVVLKHHDAGFTGGITGLPGMEAVVVPAESLSMLPSAQLAVLIARRFEAIESGSRTRGLLLTLGWVIAGFALSTLLPGAGVISVGVLAMTCLGFTLWTFVGLLTLPTLSRQASYAIDGKLFRAGVPSEDFLHALKTLDAAQDDEPNRSALVESIFHPVPSVENRRLGSASKFPIAWHAARMTLFVSWACMGMLVRAVHCNVGRPELWVMLPTD